VGLLGCLGVVPDQDRVVKPRTGAIRLGTASDRVGDWLLAGQAFQGVLLVAAREAVQASHLNQPCQVAEVRPRLREVVGVSGFPQVVLRMGYPDGQVTRAPRRPVEAVLED
jgi:hypothetical protein